MHEESGQSLLVVVLAMFLVIGLCGFVINEAQWLVARHRAQVTADSMALAAANYMATNPTAPATSGQNVGQDTHYTNGSGLVPNSATVSVDTSSGKVTAVVTTSGTTEFASAVGIGSPTIRATAVASYLGGSSPYALFAAGTCSGAYQGSVVLNLNGNVTVSGVHSNGNLSGQLGNNTTLTTMSDGCTNSLKDGSGAGAPLVPAVPSPTSLSWPVPFDSTGCQLANGTSCYFDTNAADLSTTCTYVAGTTIPGSLQGMITSSGPNITITSSIHLGSPTVLCAPNGTITIGANNVTFYGTLYANTVSANGNSLTVIPPPNDLGVYVSGTSGLQLNPGNGNGKGSNNVTLTGAYVYAPHDTVTLGGNNGSGFVESQSISVSGNNWSFTGTGPTDTYVFGDQLIQ
jgi:hypothetical protein